LFWASATPGFKCDARRRRASAAVGILLLEAHQNPSLERLRVVAGQRERAFARPLRLRNQLLFEADQRQNRSASSHFFGSSDSDRPSSVLRLLEPLGILKAAQIVDTPESSGLSASARR